MGIIDTGILTEHEDLSGRVDTGLSMNFVDDIPSTYDAVGHGSRVASIIGALSDNDQGMVGVCWDVTLVSLKIGNGVTPGNLDKVADAVIYANENNIPILNASFGVDVDNTRLREAIQNYDGLFVCSAGNNGELNNDSAGVNHYPSDYTFPNIIAVGASNEDDEKCSWSHFGNTSVDLFAPGENILSVQINGQNNGLYNTDWGTSYSAPYVAGVAALLLSAHPELTTAQLKRAIILGVDQVGALNGYCVTGGRLNAKKALEDSSIHTPGCVSLGVYSHKSGCSSASCGYGDVEPHDFVCQSSSPTHSRVCRDCRYVIDQTNDINGNYSYTNTENVNTHRVTCGDCGRFYNEEHCFDDFFNLGVNRGHKVICRECGYYYVEQHSWRVNLLKYICMECGCETDNIGTQPDIMVYEDEDEEA